MARGVRGSADYDSQLEKIDAKIERYSNLLNDLQEQRAVVLEKKQAAEMKDLYIYMSETGLTADEVLEKIKA